MVRFDYMESPTLAEQTCRRALHPLLTVISLVCLLLFVGWFGVINDFLHRTTIGLGIAFALQRGWVFLRSNGLRSERRRLGFHALLAVLVLLGSVVLWGLPSLVSGKWWNLGHISVQLVVLISGLASMIHHQTRITARAFHPGWVLMVSFFLIILAGGLLLKMPRCVVAGQDLSWLDSFFTSTSAVCVTGLAVENTALFFTRTGQVVILMLIQIGGLGIMTLTFFAAVVLFEGLSLHDQLLLGKMLQENRLAHIGRTLKFIVGMTLVCETIGAGILFASWRGGSDLGERIFHSFFHAISAFCNAGFSTLPDGLFDSAVRGNGIWQIVIMSLIVIGGLGALVNEDITAWGGAKFQRWKEPHRPRPRLRVHTRLVLWVTAFLIVGGAAGILCTEYLLHSGPENGGRVLTAFFHSVTTRTAGFNTVPMTQIGPLTVQLMMVLMLIGGSPGGTAGGMRTTVFIVGITHLWNQLRMSRRGMVAFNRRIPEETGTQALGVMVLTVIWLAVNFAVLQVLQADSEVSGTTLLFELISAFGTVGLSLDLTPGLTPEAKMLIILNMFVGRVGLLTVIATLIPPDPHSPSGKPKEDIILT